MCFSPRPAFKDLKTGQVFLTSPSSRYYNNKEWLLSTGYEKMLVPCGKCLECRMQHAREWSHRCIAEAQLYTNNYFLTLTYSDEYLPVKNRSTGELLNHATLDYKDIRQFNNSLRKHFERRGFTGFRFMVAGEYGDRNMRPHYHMIAFNLPLYDLQFYKKSILGDVYYNSPLLDRIWKRGFVVVGDLSYKSAAYVARYTVKKCKDLYDINKFDSLGIAPEFIQTSRVPGIGWTWYQMNKDKLFLQGFVDVSDGSNSVRIYPGKYFKTMYREDNPWTYEYRSKISRDYAEFRREVELAQTSYDDMEYDLVCQANFEYNHKNKLIRSDF